VHVPLMENTRGLIGAAEISKMKPTTKIFNFSRKEIVDTDAILQALQENRLAGYTTDFADEQLLHNEKVLVLPHLGASTEEAEVNCAKMAARTLKKFLEFGTIKRSVNFPTVEMAFRSPYRITIINRNVPNMLGQISSIIAESGVNIDNMLNRGRDDYAYTLVDVDSEDKDLLQALAGKLRDNENIIRVRVIQNQEAGY